MVLSLRVEKAVQKVTTLACVLSSSPCWNKIDDRQMMACFPDIISLGINVATSQSALTPTVILKASTFESMAGWNVHRPVQSVVLKSLIRRPGPRRLLLIFGP